MPFSYFNLCCVLCDHDAEGRRIVVFSLFGNVTDDNITFCAKTNYKITKFVPKQNIKLQNLCKMNISVIYVSWGSGKTIN